MFDQHINIDSWKMDLAPNYLGLGGLLVCCPYEKLHANFIPMARTLLLGVQRMCFYDRELESPIEVRETTYWHSPTGAWIEGLGC